LTPYLSGRLDVRGSIAAWPVLLFHFPGTDRVRVGAKVWFDENIPVKRNINIIEGISGRVRWFTTEIWTPNIG
jgi:hypothetical protein